MMTDFYDVLINPKYMVDCLGNECKQRVGCKWKWDSY
jgi:hypothetical protein